MPNDLDFKGAWTPPSGGAVALNFGKQGSTVSQTVTARLSATLSAPTVSLRLSYAHRVSRHLENTGHLGWRVGHPAKLPTQDDWSETARLRVGDVLPWGETNPLIEQTALPVADLLKAREARMLAWGEALPVGTQVGEHFDSLARHRQENRVPWQAAQKSAALVTERFVWLISLPANRGMGWREAGVVQVLRRFNFAPGRRQAVAESLPWGEGCQPPPGESVWQEPPVLPLPVGQVSPVALDFQCPLDGKRLLLNFGIHPCPGRALSVSILKVYFVSNSVNVVRLPGREPIPVKSIQVGIDVDSWAWGFTASLPGTALELIEPTAQGPVEIEITINGVTWVMLVEGYDIRREFGVSALSVRGRSLAAWLAEPYAPKRSFAPIVPFTARQLAENELSRAGLVTGFALDWRLDDWLVPAGAVSFEEASPVAVINRIAQAAGGFVNAHPNLKQLAAKPSYPEPPWQWASATPDASLPLDVVKTLNLRWQEKPAFNAVYVSGEQAGVVAQVKRSGTAGDVLATMVVDPLITHADAARSRGIAILSDTGKQALVTLELPMLPELGLLSPGLMLSIGAGNTAWRGLVRSTQVSAQWSEALTVRQSIELERHFL